ncbi:pilus assembly protein TadG-related protein [Streptomyces sp. NPDC093595]|uniref:pilus assembly protein TadG-related protein n=1 Tax=Streptomyces sp. NPDC093595 TaxID=3366045 RepID=UPI00380FB283
MTWRSTSDAGQATPLYITAVVGLLFLALVFFAFGQADVTRNSAQSAADAAALAAARESRDQFETGFLENILVPGYLESVFDGVVLGENGCSAAQYFAARNRAELIGSGCQWAGGGRWGFTVHVQSQQSMGKSIIEGTENSKAEATATAVVEPRCTFNRNDQDDKPDDGGDEEEEKPVSPGEFVCEGETWAIDPENLDLLPEVSDLFTVRLAED